MATDIEMYDWQALSDDTIIGVDEVGRGCLAGPVYAAAVIINPENEFLFYTDSKKISKSRREKLYSHIIANHQVGIGFATVEEITKINILNASLLAMKRAVKKLTIKTGHILVDGRDIIPGMEAFKQTALVKGDLRAEPVSAASIVAKVTRDRVLSDLAKIYPTMVLKPTKGTALQPINKSFENWAHSKSIGPLLQGSKSTYNKGHKFELMAYNYLTKNYKLIGHNVKLKYAEIDLIVRDRQNNYHLIEVKSKGLGMIYHCRVGLSQAERLLRAQTYLNHKFSLQLRTHLIVVESVEDIQIYKDFLADLL